MYRLSPIIAVLLALFPFRLAAQQSFVDSLRKELAVSRVDTTRVILLNKLAWELKNQNTEEALLLSDSALSLAEKLNFRRGLAESNKTKGVIKWYQSDLDSSRIFMKRSLDYFQEEGDLEGQANAYNNLGLSFHVSGDYAKAQEYYAQAFEIREQIGDPKGIASAHNNLGVLFYDTGDYEKALFHHTEALRLREDINSLQDLPDSYMNVGIIYLLTERYREALLNYEEALKIHQQLGNKRGMANAHHNMGNVHERQGNLNKALEKYNESLTLLRELDDKPGVSEDLRSMGEVYFKQGNLEDAREILRNGLDISKSIDDTPGMVRTYILLGQISLQQDRFKEAISDLEKAESLSASIGAKADLLKAKHDLGTAYARSGNFLKAYRYQEDFITLSDSLFSEEKSRIMAELQTKYEAEKRENQIVLLNKERDLKAADLRAEQNMNLALFITLGLILALAFVLFLGLRRNHRNNMLLTERNLQITNQAERIQHQNEELEEKNHALEELNKEKNYLVGIVAHDLRNPLNNIKGLVNIIKMDRDTLNPTQQKIVNSIGESSERLLNMVSRILDVNAIESRKHNIELARTDLCEVIELSLQEFRKEAERKGIQLDYDNAATEPFAMVDKAYAKQVFDNLISNALKFSPPNSHVAVKLATQNGKVRALVSDEGPGIPASDMSKLFQKYQKLTAKPTGGESSTGLGLSIVKKYVEEMHGKVWCEAGEKKGATFVVEFERIPA
jgi:signal transduction histidine kinase/Tfp pilus assembly protein PilF